MEIVGIFLLLFVLIFTIICAIADDCANAKLRKDFPPRYHLRKRRVSISK